jgi:hypothetical protein
MGFSAYVGAVAAAGKKAYPLPMYANCWLAEGGNFQRLGEDYRKDFELLHLEQFDVLVQFGRSNWGFGAGDAQVADGRVLIAEAGPVEFVLAGFHARVSFRAKRGCRHRGSGSPATGAASSWPRRAATRAGSGRSTAS